jgi:NAD(P)H-hydrate epimerase
VDAALAAAGADAVAAGPGLGRAGAVLTLCRALLEAAPRLVLDADALNALALAGEGTWDALRSSRAAAAGALVLTPHPGEAARLCAVPDKGRAAWRAPQGETDAAAVDRLRLEAAPALARASGATVLLKGRPTVVAHPDGRMRLNASGGPELAVGGTGDVLTGLVGGLLAQGMDAFDAAALGAHLHGLAGRAAAEGLDRGVSAMDVAAALPAAYRRLMRGAP